MIEQSLFRKKRIVVSAISASILLIVALVALWFNAPAPVKAESNFQNAFLAAYPGAHDTALDSCELCHTSGAELNSYGRDFASHGHSARGIELLDSDLDGYTNAREVAAGAFPGNTNSFPLGQARDAQSQPQGITLPLDGVYKLIGWNDLGMHCMGPNYSNISILPPYNTVWAQLILQGETPQIVTQGVTIEYRIENNTYSAGKTNFWQYDKALFGVDLPLNVGLAGKGLSGTMDLAGDHFVAAGIPLTAFYDGATPVPQNWAPYQIGHLIAKETATGKILAETRPVVPVSEEMNCIVCHGDGKIENIATGNVETNILTIHDMEEGTHLMDKRPVLCQTCHGDNALGMPGNPELPNLSRAIHNRHKVEGGYAQRNPSDPQNLGPSSPNEGTNNCYLCHPGVKTQCLRDVMWKKGLTCSDCHGTTADVGAENRRPWIDLPRCGNCHAAQYAENPNTLYRNSTGHGGLYCEACHGSPHAILPSTQPNDNIQNIALQGFAGTLRDCTVCHGSVPAGAGPHGLTAKPTPTATTTPTPTRTVTASPPPQCGKAPSTPALLVPLNGARVGDRHVTLDWASTKCARRYKLVLRDITDGSIVAQKNKWKQTSFQTEELEPGHKYSWNVTACNAIGCSSPSPTWTFRVKRSAALSE